MAGQPLNILLVEHSSEDATLVQDQLGDRLGQEFSLLRCERLDDALRCIDRQSIDVVLLDLSLPDSSGLATFTGLREKASGMPIVVLTGREDLDLASEVMQNGAQDFLPKAAITGGQLARTIRYAMQRKIWEETLRTREEHLTTIEKTEAIARLSGGLAHSYNNILTAIIGYCELLTPLVANDPTAVRATAAVFDAAQRAAGLARQLMAFCHRQPLRVAPAAIAELIAASEGPLRDALAPSVELVLTLDPAAGNVLADQSRIDEMLLDLAFSARDAMPQGGQVRIGVACRDLRAPLAGTPDAVPPGSYAVLTVSDTRPVVAPDVLAHAFDPSFTTKDHALNAGLGLATVHTSVKQHGGALQADSRVGEGTTVSIWLPRLVDPRPAQDSPGARHASVHGLESILIVEDDPQICAVLGESLSAHGYRILLASAGTEALQILSTAVPAVQLVVTDVDMPGINGYELARRLRQLRPDVRIIFISGHAEQERPAGDPMVSAYLPKPFSALTLANAIRDALKRG
ncbi:MAG: response regulator [Planctomycetes bacterium]|nr:response regulator [Planctomycetota bacterium]